MINQPETDEPLGLPRGGVRSLLSLGVVIGAFAIAAYLLAADTGSDLTKVVIGGWDCGAGERYRVLLRGAQREVADPLVYADVNQMTAIFGRRFIVNGRGQ